MSFRMSVTGVWRSFDPAEQELSVVHPFFIERDINIKNVFTLKIYHFRNVQILFSKLEIRRNSNSEDSYSFDRQRSPSG